MAAGNKHLGYKAALNAIEAQSPGTKHDFYFGFLRRASDLFTPEAVVAWCLTFAHLCPTARRNCMRIVRNLCLYWRRTAPDCFVPDPATFPASQAPRSLSE